MTAEQLLADDPIWLSIIKVVVIFVLLMVMTIFAIWFERRVVGRMQHRPGPNRVGPFGLLQSVADALKLALKEDIRPLLADRWVYLLAPIISALAAFIGFSVIPVGPQVSIFGEQTVLQVTDLPVGVLVVLAASAVGVYGIVLGGWASGSPYPLLGALRSAAQMISYEIALGLSIVAVILYTGSLSTAAIVDAQQSGWFIWLLPVSFAVFAVSMVGETNRAPFDLPEAESELVGGFHTEYSSLKFALFFLAEYVNMITLSAMATTLFLGGWRAPWPLSLIGDGVLNTGWWPVLWFVGKTLTFLFVYVWLRGTLPRLRYDQFMALGWKVLVPISLVWIVLVAGVRAIRNTEGVTSTQLLLFSGVVLVAIVLLSLLIPAKEAPPDNRVQLSGGGYPVPPLDLEVPKPPRRRRRIEGDRPDRRSPAAVGADSGRSNRGPSEQERSDGAT